jgi:hypothetical protein
VPIARVAAAHAAMASRSLPAHYWLEYIKLNGRRGYLGPIRPTRASEVLSRQWAARFARLAADTRAAYAQYARIEQLRAWLEGIPAQGTPQPVAVRPAPAPHTPQSPAPTAAAIQRALAAAETIKIMIDEDGWYRVTRNDLVTAGLSPDCDPRYLQLYTTGTEQAITVIGAADGAFDPGDAIEFYGRALESPWSDTRTYWLTEGNTPGRRITVAGSAGGRSPTASFPCTVTREEQTLYLVAVTNGEDDNFFANVLTSRAPVDTTISAVHLDPAAPSEAILAVTLQGLTDTRHHIAIRLNDTEIGQADFTGQTAHTLELSIPHDWLIDGENLISLEARGGDMDITALDRIQLSYWHTYTAEDNRLTCTAAAGKELTIAGFTSPEVRAVDITDPSAPTEIMTTSAEQDDGYGATFTVPGAGLRTLMAVTTDQVRAPTLIMNNLPSTWHTTATGADLIIISHAAFRDALTPLVTLREGQGYTVALVDVEDLYDEYRFGAHSPYAVKQFLAHAYTTWSPQPRFVLLVGDASFDPCDYMGFAAYEFVPTKLVETASIETASDDWLADFDGDLLAEMAVGRLPVANAAEATTVIDKIVTHDDTIGSTRDILLVADANDGNLDFEAAAYEVANTIPEPWELYGVFCSEPNDTEAHSQLMTALNQGPVLVNYLGHGTPRTWNTSFFTLSDADSLTNAPYLSFYVLMTCRNAFFHAYYASSLAETLLTTPQGGAVAVWASSGYTCLNGQIAMNTALTTALFTGNPTTIGTATRTAKAATTDPDIRTTWILIGDPTTRIR